MLLFVRNVTRTDCEVYFTDCVRQPSTMPSLACFDLSLSPLTGNHLKVMVNVRAVPLPVDKG